MGFSGGDDLMLSIVMSLAAKIDGGYDRSDCSPRGCYAQ